MPSTMPQASVQPKVAISMDRMSSRRETSAVNVNVSTMISPHRTSTILSIG